VNTELLQQLQIDIDYGFKTPALLVKAITHKSYKNEMKQSDTHDNQRLEFLGDSVLSLAMSKYLFTHYTDKNEGWLSKTRSLFVKEETLHRIAKEIHLGDYILLGKGEESSGGREKVSVLADAFEALLGAIYLDSNLKSAEKVVIDLYENIFETLDARGFHPEITTDYKTHLQEIVQRDAKGAPVYQLIEEIGPDHSKTFVSEVIIGKRKLGKGSGNSKKESEQMAAKAALESIVAKSELTTRT
jgi:ribonuclease III